MDLTEDLSARLLLKNILSTDPPRTPFTRSASKAQTRAARESNRLGSKDAGAQTPQDILRRSLRSKIRESITRKSLPATKRRTASVGLRRTNTPAPAPLLFDDADTPRHILMNIMQTDPVRSPVVHASEEHQLSSANSSITGKRPSIELSGLDLPDITIGNTVSTTKGLSRKRPHRSLNVTAFEKHLEGDPVRSPVVHEKTASEEPQLSSANSSVTSKRPSIELSKLDLPDVTFGNAESSTKGLSRKRPRRSLNVTTFEKGLKDVKEENEESIADHSSLSLSSSTSLSLKTPFVDVHTEKMGLQRRVCNRRKITEEEFGAAVNKRQMEGVSSFVEPGLSETTFSEGFTLGLSKLSEPDITTDIVHCKTALYAQPDAITSNFSIVATQDKPTVTASQLQRQVMEMEQEEQMEAEQTKQGKERSMYLFPTEDEVVAEPQARPEEEEDGEINFQTKEDGDKGRVVSQPEEDVAASSQPEGEEFAPDSQEEEEEGTADLQTEELGAVDSQTEEEEDIAEYESDQEDPTEGELADSHPEEEPDGEQKEENGEQEEGDGEQASEHLERDLEHISRRAHRSGGGVIPVTEAGGGRADGTESGWPGGKSRAHSDIDAHSGLEMESHESGQPHVGINDMAEWLESSSQGQTDALHTEAEPDADKENSFHLSIGDSGNLTDNSPEETAAQDAANQEEERKEDEDDDDESEEVPSKTPAFVKQKRKIFQPDPVASPTVLKNVQASSTSEGLPAPKPKQVRKRKGPAKKEGGLPKSYLMNVFKHFARAKVSADVYPVLKETMDKFFERLAEDLETYAGHAKRKTIEVEDAELLLKRQGYVNEKVPVEVLIEKYLRMDQRRLLIPIATSGNVVIPKRRR